MSIQNKEINLCGIEYRVSEVDKQVIFRCRDGMSDTEFAFEWTGCGWYLVALHDHWQKVYARHITAAFEWIEKNYTVFYIEGKGTVTYEDRT